MSRRSPLALVFAAALAAAPAVAQDVPPPRTVSVTGTAEVSTAPDMATLQLGVEAREDSAAEAMQAVAAGIGPVLERLSEAGIPSADVRTSAVELSPIYRRDPNDPRQIPEPDGFKASTTLTVRVRDIAGLPALLDGVVEDGANTLRGLTLGLQNPEELLAEARKAAVRDALAKAQLYAEAAGLSLGPVLGIAEMGAQPLPRMASRELAADMAMPIAPGSVELAAQVSVVVELAP